MKKLKLFFKISFFVFLSFLVLYIGIYVYAFFSPKLELTNLGKVFIYDQNENMIYQGSGSSDWISLDDISTNLKNAVISVEDKNFYSHHGFDYLRIIKAFLSLIKNQSITEGASTISQQYIKNMYLTLTGSLLFKR